MALSRRQFFRKFWNTEDNSDELRLARYEKLENDARHYLLPYDFTLTSAQETELFAEVRGFLEETPDVSLFSPTIVPQIQKLVESRLQPWREQSLVRGQSQRVAELRSSIPGYAYLFLNLQATPQAIDQLKARFGAADLETLEPELRQRLETWAAGLSDEELGQYDLLTVKDLVFAQLRAWC